MHCSGLDPGPENKMLNRSIMGLVGEIWTSVDSVIIIGKCFDVENYTHKTIWIQLNLENMKIILVKAYG